MAGLLHYGALRDVQDLSEPVGTGTGHRAEMKHRSGIEGCSVAEIKDRLVERGVEVRR
jgi:hypothetical protein